MSPDLKQHLLNLAQWHFNKAMAATLKGEDLDRAFHTCAAGDIRSGITSCEDAEKNAVIRDKRNSDRRFEPFPATPSAFGSL